LTSFKEKKTNVKQRDGDSEIPRRGKSMVIGRPEEEHFGERESGFKRRKDRTVVERGTSWH